MSLMFESPGSWGGAPDRMEFGGHGRARTEADSLIPPPGNQQGAVCGLPDVSPAAGLRGDVPATCLHGPLAPWVLLSASLRGLPALPCIGPCPLASGSPLTLASSPALGLFLHHSSSVDTLLHGYNSLLSFFLWSQLTGADYCSEGDPGVLLRHLLYDRQ